MCLLLDGVPHRRQRNHLKNLFVQVIIIGAVVPLKGVLYLNSFYCLDILKSSPCVEFPWTSYVITKTLFIHY